MKFAIASILAVACLIYVCPSVRAQKSPEAGYVFPAGGKAGTTVDVKLGGYDWTPDMEFFVHDSRVQLTTSGLLSPILIPPPPYWFGAKGRIGSQPLAREISAKFVLPANLEPGPIYWQAANANGATESRVFIVGNGTEVVENEHRNDAQVLSVLPATVSGRLARNEEIDRYRFTAAKDGPITCELMARRLGAKFVGILQIHDAKGSLVTDGLGTAAADPALTFIAKARAEYVVSVFDIDFGGDRSYVYRLAVTPGPRVVGAIPAAGKSGETRDVEFIVDPGAGKLESIRQKVTFPASGTSFTYQVATAAGTASPFTLLVGAEPGITGVLDQADMEKRHSFTWKKGEVWSIEVQARRIGSPLDVSVAIIGPDGKELSRNDDLPGTTDAGLDYSVPLDGTYQIVVSDTAGKSGTRAAVYRLVVQKRTPDFSLTLPVQRVRIPVDGKLDLALSVTRTGGFKGPIALTVKGLPAGVTAPADLVIPADKPSFVIPLQAAKDAGTLASLVTIEGTADLSPVTPGIFSRKGVNPAPPMIVKRPMMARAAVNLTPRTPDDGKVSSLLLATTLKPRFKGQPVDQDTGRKVHRGSTHPAEVIVERLEGYQGEIVLQMAATQSYQMQGITGGEVVVPPGATKATYPVFMPEWLETTRTSRCGMVAVAKFADPKGKIRWICNDITGYITMTMEGALLKISADEPDMTVPAAQPFDVQLKVARLTKLNQPAKLELISTGEPPVSAGGVGKPYFKADSQILPVGKEHAVMKVTPAAKLTGLHTITIRATAMQDGKYLVLSESTVTVELLPSVSAPGTPRK